MSKSASLLLRDTAVTSLQAYAPLSGVKVVSGRKRPMPGTVDRQVFVSLGEARPLETPLGIDTYITRLHLEHVARTSAAGSGEDRADELHTLTHARLQQSTALVATGYAAGDVDVRLAAVQWLEDEDDATVGICHAVYELNHRTTHASVVA